MAQLSPFRQAKLLHVFNTFFDVNRSGEIDEKDLDIAVKKVCGARGWTERDPNFRKTQKTLTQLWAILTSRADTDKDSQVSVEEWYSAWRVEESGKEWSTVFRDLMFLLEDASGDGHIDVEEYVTLYMALGMDPRESREAFSRAQQGHGGGVLTKAQFDALWDHYFYSEDPGHPGNFIFGKYQF